MDGWLHQAAQVAVARLEALLVDEQEALEVVGEGPIEDRALRMSRAIDLGARNASALGRYRAGREESRPEGASSAELLGTGSGGIVATWSTSNPGRCRKGCARRSRRPAPP